MLDTIKNATVLVYLNKIIETGSINQTAKSLQTEVKTIKKNILMLEGKLGYSILRSDTTGTSLTTEGIDFYQKNYSLLKSLHDNFNDNSRVNILKVFLPTPAMTVFITECNPIISKTPEINFELTPYSLSFIREYGYMAKQKLRSHDLIALESENMYLINPDEWIKLFEYTVPLKIITSKQYLDSLNLPYKEKEFDKLIPKLNFIHSVRENANTIQYKLNNQEHYIKVKSNLQTTGMVGQVHLMVAGLGAAIINESYLKTMSNHDLVDITPDKFDFGSSSMTYLMNKSYSDNFKFVRKFRDFSIKRYSCYINT